MTTLDELIEAIGETDLKVHNLFERDDDGLWQANLRERERANPKEVFHEFGRGRTPVQALMNALEKAGYGEVDG